MRELHCSFDDAYEMGFDDVSRLRRNWNEFPPSYMLTAASLGYKAKEEREIRPELVAPWINKAVAPRKSKLPPHVEQLIAEVQSGQLKPIED